MRMGPGHGGRLAFPRVHLAIWRADAFFGKSFGRRVMNVRLSIASRGLSCSALSDESDAKALRALDDADPCPLQFNRDSHQADLGTPVKEHRLVFAGPLPLEVFHPCFQFR